jgi:hypothetical protein
MTNTLAGAKLSIGTTLAIDFNSGDAAAQAGFEADTYTEIKEISNIGEFGAAANIVQFPVLSDDYVKKAKGTRNAGDPAIVVGYTADDPGQIAVRAAEKTKYYYNFKLVLADAQDENHTDTIIYFRALVAGVPKQFGGNEDFVTETYALGIFPGPLELPSESFSPTSP